MVDIEAHELSIKNDLNDVLNEMGLSLQVSEVYASNDVPQETLVFDRSNVAPSTLKRVSDRFTQSIEEVGGTVEYSEVIAVTLTPRDKIRSKLGV